MICTLQLLKIPRLTLCVRLPPFLKGAKNKGKQKGSFLLETVIAMSLIAFILHAFVSYTLKMKHSEQKAEQEINFSNYLTVLSERLYQSKDKQATLRAWQKEFQEAFRHVEMTFKSTPYGNRIEFKTDKTDEVRVFLL